MGLYLEATPWSDTHPAMQALLYTEPFHLNYTETPDPEVGPDDVLVRVKAVGICGSDVHGYTGRTGRRLPPLIMGHEAAGVVETVGARVKGVAPGSRVCFDSTVCCNRCDACRQGRYNRCAHRQVLGVSVPGMKRHGAMADLVRLPWWSLVEMPAALSFTEAALLEPVSIGLHAVNRGPVAPGETVLIVGAGTIGLFVLQAARLKGAGKVIVSDLNTHRLRQAQKLGADVVVSPDDANLASVVEAQTQGHGADVSFEVVGLAQTLQQTLAATRMGGRVVLVGNLTKTVEIDVPDVVSRELTLRGTYASSGEYRDAVDLVASGRIDVRPLVNATLPLSQGQHAFDRLYRGEEAALIKIVLEP